jgi:flagellar hook-basal body complex protein FliE
MFAVLSRSRISKKGLTHMAYRANQQLRENIWDYRYNSSPDADENVLDFNRPAAKEHGPNALNLVQQAAEMFESMEHHARETEARSQALCKSLTEKLRLAERQQDASERAGRQIVNQLNRKLEDVSKALQQAQKRIAVAEDHALAAEFRAQAAEVHVHKANRDLLAVEEAIRKRLL